MDNSTTALSMETMLTNINSTTLHRIPMGNTYTEDLRRAFVSTYLLAFVLGVCGNSLVIYIIGQYKEVRLKSVADSYIWNLAFADLFYVLTLPLFCYTTMTGDWPFGGVACKLSFAIRETNKFTSVFTLVALSADRYLASFYNMGHLRTLKVGRIVCISVWLLAMMLSIPYWMFSFTVTSKTSGKQSCRFHWPRDGPIDYHSFWVYFQLVVGLVAPFTLIIICYCGLISRLHHILKSGIQKRRSKIQKPSRRMTRTVVVVVLTFLICHLPYHVMEILNLKQTKRLAELRQMAPPALISSNDSVTYPMVINTYSISEYNIRIYIILTAVSHMLVFLSSCCNPIIYGLLNENYRQLYSATCCCCFRLSNASSGSTSLSSHTPLQQISYRLQLNSKVEILFKKMKQNNNEPLSGHSKLPAMTEEVELE